MMKKGCASLVFKTHFILIIELGSKHFFLFQNMSFNHFVHLDLLTKSDGKLFQ